MSALHLHAWGDETAPALVCLHGIGGHGGRYRALAERLADRFRVLAPDLRGHGRSEWEPPWSLEQHVGDVAEATADATPATWVGHSFGARVVLEVTARRPELVDRVVLLDPAVWVPPQAALERAEQARVDEVFASVEAAVDERLAVPGLFAAAREVVRAEMEEHLQEREDGLLHYRICRSAVVAGYGELARYPPPFERLRVPMLLVHGVESDVCPPFAVAALAGELGDPLAVVPVPGGHNVLWNSFSETAEAIERFLGAGAS